MPFLWKVKWKENIEHDFIKSPCTRTKKRPKMQQNNNTEKYYNSK